MMNKFFLVLLFLGSPALGEITFTTKNSTATTFGDYKTEISSWAIRSTVAGKQLTISRNLKNYKIYTKHLDESKFDIGLIFDVAPSTNMQEFHIDGAKNFVFNKIPFLTEEEKARGCTADYGSEGGYSICDKGPFPKQKFIAYRPEAIDSAGSRIWCDLWFNPKMERFEVVCAEKWLDSARYPVTLDPTFGNTDIYGTNNNLDNSYQVRYKAGLMPESGTVTSISICAWNTTGAGSYKLALYYDSGGNYPNALVANSSIGALLVTRTTKPTLPEHWTTGNVGASCTLTAGTTIWIGFCNLNNGGDQMNFAYTGGGGTSWLHWRYVAGDYAGFPQNPCAAGDYQNYKASIYFTYIATSNPKSRVSTNSLNIGMDSGSSVGINQ